MDHKFNSFLEEFALKRIIELRHGFSLPLRMYEFGNLETLDHSKKN